jgi:hypothetical protein
LKYFALIDSNNFVVNTSVGDDNWSAEGWVEYTNENPAFIGGDLFDGVFYTEKPYPSWVRNGSGIWVAPVDAPLTGKWNWDEPTLSWIEVSE